MESLCEIHIGNPHRDFLSKSIRPLAVLRLMGVEPFAVEAKCYITGCSTQITISILQRNHLVNPYRESIREI